MAIHTGGYDCEFVETPPKVVQTECPVCLQIIQEPYQADCCGYAFCRECIGRIKMDSKCCPCCKAEQFNTFEDKRLKGTLYAFKVYCTNKRQGCQWEGELSQLDNHLNSIPSHENQQEGCQFNASMAQDFSNALIFKSIKICTVPNDPIAVNIARITSRFLKISPPIIGLSVATIQYNARIGAEKLSNVKSSTIIFLKTVH